jgi:hypothetical protein
MKKKKRKELLKEKETKSHTHKDETQKLLVWVQGGTACSGKESLRVEMKLWKLAFNALQGRFFFFFFFFFCFFCFFVF